MLAQGKPHTTTESQAPVAGQFAAGGTNSHCCPIGLLHEQLHAACWNVGVVP
jgi:hypothetical protein